MRMESLDMVSQNIKKIETLFPNCITETIDENGKPKKAINFELLRQMLSDDVIEGDEAYEFTWVGKKASIVEANKPIRKTLRPCPEESVNWNKTENLYIEGDNLEVLKLLQESYLGKVKMIYIDPPYNTGSDFIYQEYDMAQFELGNMYLRGIGAKKSYKKAIEWFQKAADNGNRDAKRLLKDLAWDDKKTLFVYRGNNYCLREGHDIISATAVLKGRNNPHIELDVDYCMKCHKFFINMIEYDLCKERYRYLLGRILFDKTSSKRYISNGFSLESPLMLRGYNVNEQNGLTEKERHFVIADILDYGDMTKADIKDYLNRFVAFNGSKEGNEKARQKWKCDLKFTKDYRKNEQPKVTIKRIKKS